MEVTRIDITTASDRGKYVAVYAHTTQNIIADMPTVYSTRRGQLQLLTHETPFCTVQGPHQTFRLQGLTTLTQRRRERGENDAQAKLQPSVDS